MRILQSFAAAAILSCAPLAHAQQTISEYATLGYAIFSAQDVTELDKAAKLSPAQKESIESLMRDAVARARPLLTKLGADWQEKAEAWQDLAFIDPQKYQEAYEKYYADYSKASVIVYRQITAIERETLGDIRTALTDDQNLHAWPAFERARRRLLMCNGQYFNLGTSPQVLIDQVVLSTADRAAIQDAMARYELDLDPLLVERMDGLQRWRKEAEEKGEPALSPRDRPDPTTEKIRRLNTRAAQAIEKALSESGRQAFLRQRIGIELRNMYFNRPSKDEQATSIRKLATLTQEQKAAADDLITKADSAMFQCAVEFLRQVDESILRETPDTPEKQEELGKQQQAEFGEKYAQARRVTADLNKSLRALLTESQLDELDYSALAPGGDPFKAPRERIESSEWTDPKPR